MADLLRRTCFGFSPFSLADRLYSTAGTPLQHDRNGAPRISML
jgi:hypothetical protein